MFVFMQQMLTDDSVSCAVCSCRVNDVAGNGDDDDDDDNDDLNSSMASAAPHTTPSSAVHVPEFVITGDKFLKWDDVSYSSLCNGPLLHF